MTVPVKVLITQQLNASEILFSARKQSIGVQRKRLNSTLFHSLSDNETVRTNALYSYRIFQHKRREKRERETDKENRRNKE